MTPPPSSGSACLSGTAQSSVSAHTSESTSPLSSSEFYADVMQGLSGNPKSLPSKYLYDHQGSLLFDQICELEEYYLTRCELEILQTNGDEIAHLIGREAVLAELGSGSSQKTRTLLDSLYDPVAYVPIEISEEFLLATVSKLQLEYPTFPVEPLVADFTQPFQLPRHLAEHRVCVFFPGSTIGNLERDAAIELLRHTNRLCQPGAMLIGIDLQKDVITLERAYDDRDGVTAQFSLNLLNRINRELDG